MNPHALTIILGILIAAALILEIAIAALILKIAIIARQIKKSELLEEFDLFTENERQIEDWREQIE